ncbi:MAG: hypothetical protein KGI50_05875 [Patescibacteria group bacterium]|nr:hypothetical protein [Patescibacteria group bacterium]MDE2438804.1 hypothetical protein [Patescibacteria group bacterium]
MNKKRLIQLADYLDNLDPKFWNFRVTMCGSVGCAVGHLPNVFPKHFDARSYLWEDAPKFFGMSRQKFVSIFE